MEIDCGRGRTSLMEGKGDNRVGRVDDVATKCPTLASSINNDIPNPRYRWLQEFIGKSSKREASPSATRRVGAAHKQQFQEGREMRRPPRRASRGPVDFRSNHGGGLAPGRSARFLKPHQYRR